MDQIGTSTVLAGGFAPSHDSSHDRRQEKFNLVKSSLHEKKCSYPGRKKYSRDGAKLLYSGKFVQLVALKFCMYDEWYITWFSLFNKVEAKCLPINPCQNGGTCTEALGSYHCNCMSGWQGLSCESKYVDK